MTVLILQAVERSVDGDKFVRVTKRWPYEAADLNDAMAFVDRNPTFAGWGKTDRFEVLDVDSRLMASKSFGSAAEWALPEEGL